MSPPGAGRRGGASGSWGARTSNMQKHHQGPAERAQARWAGAASDHRSDRPMPSSMFPARGLWVAAGTGLGEVPPRPSLPTTTNVR
jgi:hypothetical protein